MVYPRDKYWVQSSSTSSLMTWMTRQSMLSKFADNIKLGELADMPESCAEGS